MSAAAFFPYIYILHCGGGWVRYIRHSCVLSLCLHLLLGRKTRPHMAGCPPGELRELGNIITVVRVVRGLAMLPGELPQSREDVLFLIPAPAQ